MYSDLTGWGGRIRTFGMTESESVALPLGDTPMFNFICLSNDLIIIAYFETDCKG